MTAVMNAKRKRGKSHTKHIVASFVMIIAILIIIVTSQSNQPNQTRPPADQYLEVQHTRSLGRFYNQNQTVQIMILGLKIKAVGGDAHDILIDFGGAREYEIIPEILQGELHESQIETQGYATDLENGFFPVTLDIRCDEAEWATVILYLRPDPEDIVALPSYNP